MNPPACMTSSPPITADGSPAAEAAALAPWFHNLHLPDGTQTAPAHPLGDFPRNKWEQIAPLLPADLDGCHVLDVGCNAGFYSIELARRGALVSALDLEPHFLRQAHWAAQQFGSGERITLYHGHVYDLARWRQEFEIVLFLGVFYHLRHPLLALDIITPLVGRTLVFQTLSMPDNAVAPAPDDLPLEARDAFTRPGWPRMAFIEHAYAGDSTNWWAPNLAGTEAMLRSSGLEIIARPGHELFICRPVATPDEHVQLVRQEAAAATGTGAGGISLFDPTAATAHRPLDADARSTAPPTT